MITINANTKIAKLIKLHPDALEAIIKLSPKFNKLRNPILRKVIAGRTSIAMASKIGSCTVDDFFHSLQPLGFEIDTTIPENNEIEVKTAAPEFQQNLTAEKIIPLDVRPIIDGGEDPLNQIIQKVNGIRPGTALKIINSFEPTPLIKLLQKKCFESYTEKINEELFHTYFFKPTETACLEDKTDVNAVDWDAVLKRFDGKLQTIDVRDKKMPIPMHLILASLNELPAGKALFVYHKRIPVFLLPELEEMSYSYRIKEICDGEVRLLIYKE